jgi:hypothetical protein
MAIFSPDTFDPLKRYISVRIGQGVPLVHADVNELDDIRNFEVRAFLKWFVGDGVPEGSDAFSIAALAAPASDFTIEAGAAAVPAGLDNISTGLGFVGRCLVDGLDAVITKDVNFTDQDLFVNKAGSAQHAADWGVPVVPALPDVDATVLIYLDVWDRLVTPDEEGKLIFPGLGTESAARRRREWVVRWTSAAAVPAFGGAEFIAGHSYYALAGLKRRAANPVVATADVTDLRERRLLVPPASLIEDMLGTTPTRYRQGLDRPTVSIREAVNALMRGELPSTDDTPLAPAAAQDFMSFSFTVAAENVVALWHSRRAANVNQVFLTQWPVHLPGAASTSLPAQITTGPTPHAAPSSVLLPGGDLVVAYETAQQDITAKRGAPNGLAGASEIVVSAAAGGITGRQPFAVLAGDLVVFFWQASDGTTRTWRYRRWRHTDNTFVDAAPLQLSATNAAALSGGLGDFHAAVDGNGDVWAAFRADELNNNAVSIHLVRLRPLTIQLDEQTLSTGGTNEQPFVLVDGAEAVWVFWRSGSDPATAVSYQKIALPPPATWPVMPPPTAVTGAASARPSAVRDAEGPVWLFWSQLTGIGTVRAVWLQRYLKSTNSWGAARQLTGSAAVDDQPYAVLGPGGVVLLFWLSNRSGNLDIYSKQFITAL